MRHGPHDLPMTLLKNPLRFYVRMHWRPLLVGMLFLLVTNVLDGLWPLILKEGVDRITASAEMSSIARVGAAFFLVMAGLAVSRYWWRVGIGRFHTLSGEDLRQRAFRHLSGLTPSFLLRKPVGELMSLLTNDIQTFRRAIGDGLLVFVDGILILAVVLPTMFSLSVKWTLPALIFLPVTPFLIWAVTRKIHRASKRQQELFADVTAHCQESVAGIRVVKGFALEDVRLASFNAISAKYESACNETAKIDALFFPVMELGLTVGTIAFLFVAKDDLVSGAVTIGTFVAFHRYILKTVWPMAALGMGLSSLQKGFASFERVAELLKETPDLQTAGNETLERFESLELRNVGFRYPGGDRWILRGVSFTLRRGESLGIAGPVAAGKTTLMALLTRQFDPTEGEILLNGRPLRSYPLEAVRARLTLIPQDVFLFSETVTENIGFGRDNAFEDPEAAALAKSVELHDEINRLPDGYRSLVGEKGVNLSGGQRQRMALARGLAVDADVLLLDDVLSAVDTRTERRIEDVLRKQRADGRTHVLIAHRLSTLASCDHLLVLIDGAAETFGERHEALRASPFLQRLKAIQETGEALA